MTVALEDRPRVELPRVSGNSPARRAVARWAWRLFRREWRQQLLILLLVTLAVGATTVGIALVSNAGPRPAAFGTANHILGLRGTDPNLTAELASTRAPFAASEVVAHERIDIPGSVSFTDLRAQDAAGTYGRSTLRLLRGRYPRGRSDVAITDGTAATFELHLGSTWKVGGRTRTVVGIVENPLDLNDEFGLVPPGQIDQPTQVSVLVDATDVQVNAATAGMSVTISTPQSFSDTTAAVIVLVMETIGLLFVGLVAAAGFAVMAQRRMRALGMLGAIGATDRHIRFAMVANGAAVGATAALVGAAAGLGGWLLWAPHAATLVGHRIDRFAIPWWALGVAILLAVATAVAAAWWPARAVARVPIVTSLSGRPPRPQPAHRFATLGVVLLATGFAFLAFAVRPAGSHGPGDHAPVNPAFVIGGAIATTLGMLLLGPLGIRTLATFARRAPIALRLALRDLARYQARSAAALGAISLTIAIAATIAISATAAAAPPAGGLLPANELIVHLTHGNDHIIVDGLPALPQWPAATIHTVRGRVDALAATLHASTAVELTQAIDPEAGNFPGALDDFGAAGASKARATPGRDPGATDASASPPVVVPVALSKVETRSGGRPGATGSNFTDVVDVYVATPALLAQVGIDPASIPADADIISSRTDLGGLVLATARGRGIAGGPIVWHPTIRHADLPTSTHGTDTLITAHGMARFGLTAVTAGYLIQTPRPLTTAQIDAARHTAGAAGVTVETRPTNVSYSRLRNGATTAGFLVALGVLAMTVGLMRSETANDLRTLAATGATATTRRMLTGATAGALGLLGAAFGTAGAYLALVAWHRRDLAPLGHVPWLDLVVIVAGLPLVATAAAWVLAGREPPNLGRHPIE